MTANAMSSAPAITNLETVCDDKDRTVTDDGYTSSGDGPVQITANMMSNDELWLLHSDTTVPSTHSNDPTPSVFSTPAVPIELQPTLPSATLPGIPVDSTPLSYLLAFRADLTTLEGIDLHENRIYQPGLTPSEIRRKVKLALRTESPYPHLVNFLARDIPHLSWTTAPTWSCTLFWLNEMHQIWILPRAMRPTEPCSKCTQIRNF